MDRFVKCLVLGNTNWKYNCHCVTLYPSCTCIINYIPVLPSLTKAVYELSTNCTCGVGCHGLAISFQWSSHFLAATKQLYEWYFPSVCLSVTPFSLRFHHRIIMKISGLFTSDNSDVHAKGQGHWWKVKVTEVTAQLNRFQTVTPVEIHIWWWNDAYSSMLLRKGALLFFKVIHQISRSRGYKNLQLWFKLGFSGLQVQLNSPMAMKWCTKL